MTCYREGDNSGEVPDDTTAGCLVTDNETCAVCGGEEGEGQEHKIVKNYKQGGHVRIVIEFSKSGYTSTNQVRLCQRNGQQTMIITRHTNITTL